MGLLDSILGAGGNATPGSSDNPAAGGGDPKMMLLTGLLTMIANRQGGQTGAAQGQDTGLLGSLGGLLGGAGSGGGLGGMLEDALGGGAQGNGTGATSPTTGALGGLAGLTELLRNGGLGEAVESWIGTGANQSVSAEQVGQALDQSGHLQQLADAAGISKDQAAQHLSELLPEVISRLTPNGNLPEGPLNLGSLAAQLLNR